WLESGRPTHERSPSHDPRTRPGAVADFREPRGDGHLGGASDRRSPAGRRRAAVPRYRGYFGGGRLRGAALAGVDRGTRIVAAPDPVVLAEAVRLGGGRGRLAAPDSYRVGAVRVVGRAGADGRHDPCAREETEPD